MKRRSQLTKHPNPIINNHYHFEADSMSRPLYGCYGGKYEEGIHHAGGGADDGSGRLCGQYVRSCG